MPSSRGRCAESPSVPQEPGQVHSTHGTAMPGHTAGSDGHRAATGCPAAHHQTPHSTWEAPMETGPLCPSPLGIRPGAAPAAGRGEHRAMGAAGGQGGRSGTGPGRCCSHPGSADSPQVPVPGLSPSAGRWELPASPQPPASAALAIYTRPGRRPSPGNPETQQQPRHWTHPSVRHIPPAWLQPWAALPGPGRPCSTTATELRGTQPQEPVGTPAPCPAPAGPATGSPSVAAPAPTGAALGQGARLPSPSWRPTGLPPPSHSSSSSFFSSQPIQPQGATGRFQPPPANSKRLLLSPRAPGDGFPGLGGPQRWAGAGLCPLRWGKRKGLLLLLGEFQRVAEDLESRLLIIESTCLGRFTADTEHRLAPGGGKRHKGIKVPGPGPGPPHAACTAVPGHWGRSGRTRGDAGVREHSTEWGRRCWNPGT